MNKLLLSVIPCALVLSAHAQQGPALTAKDYERAESFLSYGTEPFIDNASVRPDWLPDGRFWYRNLNANGSEFIVVDPAKGTRSPAFDQAKLAASLSSATGKQYTASMLPFVSINFAADGKSMTFNADGKQWKADLGSYAVTADSSPAGEGRGNAAEDAEAVAAEADLAA